MRGYPHFSRSCHGERSCSTLSRALERWPFGALLVATGGFVAALYAAGLPAAFLLGAMAAALLLSGRGASLRLPGWLFSLAQAVVGCLIARSFTPALFRTIGQHFVLFAGATLSVLLVATALGLLLTRLRVLPGSTALWGSFPGAATVMVLLSESFGADMRLVAVMQYLRVIVVAATASLVARGFGVDSATHAAQAWFAPLNGTSLAILLAIILLGGLVGPRLRLPAAPMLVPMMLTTVLQDAAGLKVELPPLLLVASYLIVGWAIGLRFTPELCRQAARALPRLIPAIATLVAGCAAIGWVLAHVAHLDLLTAYLATSPGGADSVAIIAAGTPVDVSLVMAIQTGRFLSVLLIGPSLARGAARLAGIAPALGGQRT